MQGIERLERIRNLNKNPNYVNTDLYRLFYKEDLYVAAYEKIKSKPGNLTPGSDTETLDGFNINRVDSIIADMRSEAFQFKPFRRIYIPKPKTEKMRPLGLPSPVDKVVQEIMRNILEAIYEPIFLDVSHGFRPNRSPATALKQLRNTFQGVNWVLEGDIKGAYDNINQDKFLVILGKKIHDRRFINLVRKAFAAGYVEDKYTIIPQLIGTPQGSIVSPIIANIYFHELDVYILDLGRKIEEKYAGKKVVRSEYTKITTRIQKNSALLEKLAVHRTPDSKHSKGDETPTNQQSKELSDKIKADKQLRLKEDTFNPESIPIKLRYVRYADDWLIGINGPKHLIVTIRESVESYLKKGLGLELSSEKTLITRFDSNHVLFLGYRAKIARNKKVLKTVKDGKTIYRRTTGHLVKLTVPIPRVIERLALNGYCDSNGNGISRKMWTVHDDYLIVSTFKAVILGIINYYSLADYRDQLHRIFYILRTSCSKTLAHRHKSSAKKMFTKHGKPLKVSKTVELPNGTRKTMVVELPKIDFSKKGTETSWKDGHNTRNPFDIQLSQRTRSKLGISYCVICSNNGPVEMHHVRHIRTAKPVTGFNQLMQRVNRKQIPVCKNCHSKIHRGTYDAMNLSDIPTSNIEEWTNSKARKNK